MKVNLRSVDLNLLTVFDAVIQEGKMSAAAQALNMTQPAVSNAVARLRLTFDDELFIRSRYGMSPTPKASELIGPIREALNIIRATLDPSVEFDPASSTRAFNLAIGDYGELILLPALLRIFSECGGDMSIHTYPEHDDESLQLVKQGKLDFFFDYHPPQGDQLDYCAIGEDEVVVIARNNHPQLKGKLTKKDYLAGKHVVLKQGDQSATLLDMLWEDQTLAPRKVMAKVRQYVAMPGLVTQTDCLATVPLRMAEQYAQSYALTIHPFPFNLSTVTSYMIWHRSLARDKGHRWLKNIILDLARTTSS